MAHTPDQSVPIDGRPPRWPGDDPAPSEADVEHFVRLRNQLGVVRIRLMDAVIFDGGVQWWTMCELLTGTTTRNDRPFPQVDVERLRRAA